VIQWRSNEPEHKAGLLVLDPKADDTIERVSHYAEKAGRLNDLVVLSEDSNAWYDLLAIRHIDALPEAVRRFLASTDDMGPLNSYWSELRRGLVENAILIMLANGAPIRFSDAIDFMQAWWFTNDSKTIDPKLKFAEQVIERLPLHSLTRRRLELAIREAKTWSALDLRTREIAKSTLGNCIRPLLVPTARQLFDHTKPLEFRPADVLNGKILIVSLDALRHKEVARLIFRVVRSDYYSAVLSRNLVRPDEGRLAGLCCDELALSVMPEIDETSLSVLRSKGGFVLACAQNFSGLDAVLGRRGRDALLANFNSFFFFQSRENAMDEFAFYTLGLQKNVKGSSATFDHGDLQIATGSLPSQPVCPPGRLAALPQLHVFAKLATGFVTQKPVCLEPQFHNIPVKTISQKKDDLAEAVESLKSQAVEEKGGKHSVPEFLIHMHRRGYQLRLTQGVIAAAWQICVPRVSQNEMIVQARSIGIPGIESLPLCWAVGFLEWCFRNKQDAASIRNVCLSSGVLWPEVEGPTQWWGNGALIIPESINTFVYPSLWRRLKPRHSMQLRVMRPDLRSEVAIPERTDANGQH
jgi:hypothetical protein